MSNPAVVTSAAARQVQKHLQFAPSLLESQFFQWCLLPSNDRDASPGADPNPGTIILHPNVQIRKMPSKGYDLVSLTSIPANTEVLKVPRDYWEVFSAQTACHMLKENSSGFYQKLDAVSNQLLSSQSKLGETFLQSFSLAFYLAMNSTTSEAELAEEVNASVYFTLLRQQSYPFQSQYLAPPLLMSAATDIDPFLSGLKMHRDIMIRKNMYEKLALHLVGGDNVNHPLIKDFLWAMGVVLSRALSSPTIPFTMIPILDFANHGDESVLAKHKQLSQNQNKRFLSPVNIHHHYDASSGTFSLITDREIHPQESLCISYGPKRDTSSFITLYGFLGNYSNANDQVLLNFNALQDFQFLKDTKKCEQILLMFQEMIVVSLGLDRSRKEDSEHLQKLMDNYQITIRNGQISMSLPLLTSFTSTESWSKEDLEEQGHASMQMMVWLLKLADLMEHAEVALNETPFQDLMTTSKEDWNRVENFLNQLLEAVYVSKSKLDAFGYDPAQVDDVASAFANHLAALSKSIEPIPSYVNERGEVQVHEPKPLSAMEYWKACSARIVERELREVLRLKDLANERSQS